MLYGSKYKHSHRNMNMKYIHPSPNAKPKGIPWMIQIPEASLAFSNESSPPHIHWGGVISGGNYKAGSPFATPLFPALHSLPLEGYSSPNHHRHSHRTSRTHRGRVSGLPACSNSALRYVVRVACQTRPATTMPSTMRSLGAPPVFSVVKVEGSKVAWML